MTGERITRRQIADQLRRCARMDGRVLDPQTFEDWYDLLGDLPFEDVRAAITAHYRTSEKWIMPAHIVAYHEQQAAARLLEQARLNPPACWGGGGCEVRYVLSSRPGSRWALPDREHAEGCRAYKGVLKFNPERGTWPVMTIDPALFDEDAFEAPVTHELWRSGPASVDWVSRLAVGAGDDGDEGEDAGE
jgi:hypothetical protein